MRRLLDRLQWLAAGWLTVVWVMLWGNVSWANVLAGFALALLILAVFPLPSLAVGVTVRPVALVVLLSRFFADMTRASVQVAWTALRPGGGEVRGMVVDMHLRSRNELFQTITAEMVALVPGSIVIDLEPDTGTLTLHVFDVSTRREAERIRLRVLAQEARVLRALDPDPGAALDPRRRRQAQSSGGVS